jgi:hypothetical protein
MNRTKKNGTKKRNKKKAPPFDPLRQRKSEAGVLTMVKKGCWNCAKGGQELTSRCATCLMTQRTFLPNWKKTSNLQIRRALGNS